VKPIVIVPAAASSSRAIGCSTGSVAPAAAAVRIDMTAAESGLLDVHVRLTVDPRGTVTIRLAAKVRDPGQQ
jgi:hypothetical protein